MSNETVYEQIVENNADGIIVLKDRQIIYANRRKCARKLAVESNGGKIRIDSKVGEGTKATVRLPL